MVASRMPKHSMTFEVPATPSEALLMARRLVAERGWSVESLTDGRLVTRRAMRASSWPITIELSVADTGAGAQVTADGKIGGWGPIQRKQLVGAMAELRASFEFEASAQPQPDSRAG
jgi:hypothetical protein